MAIGVIGQKAGMSRIFEEKGTSVPCTVIRVIPNRIAQVRTVEKDGYQALQLVGGEDKKASRITRPMKGHFRKMSILAGKEIHEFRVADSEIKEAGGQIGVEIFSEGQKVKVTGISKGKGFAGTIKRYNFRGQDNSHGNSLSHRVMGSVGQCQFPGRVFKGKKMPGQMGNVWVTVKNLEIVKVDKERQLLWIKGAVPGSRNHTVLIRHLSDIDLQAVSPDTQTEQQQPTASETAKSQQPKQATATKSASASSQATEEAKVKQVSEPEATATKSASASSQATEEAKTKQVSEPEQATETKEDLEPKEKAEVKSQEQQKSAKQPPSAKAEKDGT